MLDNQIQGHREPFETDEKREAVDTRCTSSLRRFDAVRSYDDSRKSQSDNANVSLTDQQLVLPVGFQLIVAPQVFVLDTAMEPHNDSNTFAFTHALWSQPRRPFQFPHSPYDHFNLRH